MNAEALALLDRAAAEVTAGRRQEAIATLRLIIDAIAPPPPWPNVELTFDEAEAALRGRAFKVEPEHEHAGETLIHCRAGGFGADWNIEDAVATVRSAKWVGWITSIVGHELGAESPDGSVYAFDVPRPERAEYAKLRGLER